MSLLNLETYTSRLRLIGVVALLIGIGAWVLDLTGLVYECPFCRTQRTVIGVLGLILMMPNPRHWILRYIGCVIAFLGAHVAAAQNFSGWRAIWGGTFELRDPFFIDPFLLSGCALFIITGLVWLLLLPAPTAAESDTSD